MASKNGTRPETRSVAVEIQWEPAEECEVEVAHSALGVLPRNVLQLSLGALSIETANIARDALAQFWRRTQAGT